MNRHIVAQVVLFALISVVAIGYGIAYIREDADVARRGRRWSGRDGAPSRRASHALGYAGAPAHRCATASLTAFVSSGTTWNRSPTMP